jgi:membrane protein YqaA with SNARE-associated domain
LIVSGAGDGEATGEENAPVEGAPAEPLGPLTTSTSRARRVTAITAGIVGMLLLNLAAYWLLTRDPVQEWLNGLVSVIYPGAFLLALVANLTVLIPIPYNGIMLAILGKASLPWLAALLAAAGSVLGELTGYAAGRAGRQLLGDSKAVTWATERMSTPRRAFVFLVILSAPPNPLFDMAGLTAGTLKIPLRIFLPAVFIGRSVRFLAFAYVSVGLVN